MPKERKIPDKYIDIFERIEGTLWQMRVGDSVYNRGLHVGAQMMRHTIEEAIAYWRAYLAEDMWHKKIWKPSIQFYIAQKIAHMKLLNISSGGINLTGVQEGYLYFGERFLEAVGGLNLIDDQVRKNSSTGKGGEVRGSVQGANGSLDRGDPQA